MLLGRKGHKNVRLLQSSLLTFKKLKSISKPRKTLLIAKCL